MHLSLFVTLFLVAQNVLAAGHRMKRVHSRYSSTLARSTASKKAFSFSPGFDIQRVAAVAKSLPTHSWEFGTATEALLELYNPELSVFGPSPFPLPSDFDPSSIEALSYASKHITLGGEGLSNGSGATGDPASLLVAAVMIGKTKEEYGDAADREVEYLTKKVPRFWNGAISQRADVPELWADFMYMAPPSLAYYAVDKSDWALLNDTIQQCLLYRQVLQANLTEDAPYRGVWHHIIWPQSEDKGLWSTGNGWAAAGMTRVLATLMKAPIPSDLEAWRSDTVVLLTDQIKEIMRGVVNAPMDQGLLRNYLDDKSNSDGHGFGEISGTSILASVAYRMCVLQPDQFCREYIPWADNVVNVLGGKNDQDEPFVTTNGTVAPAVNPLAWKSLEPWTAGSPEGNNFVVLMYAAWRDCVLAGCCSK